MLLDQNYIYWNKLQGLSSHTKVKYFACGITFIFGQSTTIIIGYQKDS